MGTWPPQMRLRPTRKLLPQSQLRSLCLFTRSVGRFWWFRLLGAQVLAPRALAGLVAAVLDRGQGQVRAALIRVTSSVDVDYVISPFPDEGERSIIRAVLGEGVFNSPRPST